MNKASSKKTSLLGENNGIIVSNLLSQMMLIVSLLS